MHSTGCDTDLERLLEVFKIEQFAKCLSFQLKQWILAKNLVVLRKRPDWLMNILCYIILRFHLNKETMKVHFHLNLISMMEILNLEERERGILAGILEIHLRVIRGGLLSHLSLREILGISLVHKFTVIIARVLNTPCPIVLN